MNSCLQLRSKQVKLKLKLYVARQCSGRRVMLELPFPSLQHLESLRSKRERERERPNGAWVLVLIFSGGTTTITHSSTLQKLMIMGQLDSPQRICFGNWVCTNLGHGNASIKCRRHPRSILNCIAFPFPRFFNAPSPFFSLIVYTAAIKANCFRLGLCPEDDHA